MPHRTRMFKALGCLAAAMLVTSWLLTWLEPDGLMVKPTVSPAALLDASSSAVRESGAIDSDRWQEVEVVVGPATAIAAQRLSAVPDNSESHFVIDDENGRQSARAGLVHSGVSQSRSRWRAR